MSEGPRTIPATACTTQQTPNATLMGLLFPVLMLGCGAPENQALRIQSDSIGLDPSVAFVAPGEAELRFGAFPYLDPIELESLLTDFTSYLSVGMELPVSFGTSSTFELFQERLLRGDFDVALVQPFDYVALPDDSPYEAVAGASIGLTALFVTKQISDIRSVADLRGLTLAFPPRQAAVTYLGRMTLLENDLRLGIDLESRYQRNHQSCLRHVVIGTAAACVTNAIPFSTFVASAAEPLRIFAESRELPHILFVVHRDLPSPLRTELVRLLLSTGTDQIGGIALRAAGLPTFVAVTDSDFDPVRAVLNALGGG